jgi:hypothetical protein
LTIEATAPVVDWRRFWNLQYRGLRRGARSDRASLAVRRKVPHKVGSAQWVREEPTLTHADTGISKLLYLSACLDSFSDHADLCRADQRRKGDRFRGGEITPSNLVDTGLFQFQDVDSNLGCNQKTRIACAHIIQSDEHPAIRSGIEFIHSQFIWHTAFGNLENELVSKI